MIYSHFSYIDLLSKISKISKTEREMLVTKYSEVLDVKQILKFKSTKMKAIISNLDLLEYAIRLSNGVEIKLKGADNLRKNIFRIFMKFVLKKMFEYKKQIYLEVDDDGGPD